MNEGSDADWQPVIAGSMLAQQTDQIRLRTLKRAACEAEAEGIVKSNVVQAMAAGLIPVPLLDIVALSNIQFKMVDDLVRLYNLRYTRIEKDVVRAFILGVLPVAGITGVSSTLKLLPGIGSLLGSAGVSVTAGGLTCATGKIFIRHFSTGGTLTDFNLTLAKQHFMKEFRQGKQFVRKQAHKPPLFPPP